jgi:hypothetical protein
MEAAVAAALPSVLSPDNAARKAAEAQLQARSATLRCLLRRIRAAPRLARAAPRT